MQQISPDNVPSKINSLLDDGVGNVAKLAIVILVERKMGQVLTFLPFFFPVNNRIQDLSCKRTIQQKDNENKWILIFI